MAMSARGYPTSSSGPGSVGSGTFGSGTGAPRPYRIPTGIPVPTPTNDNDRRKSGVPSSPRFGVEFASASDCPIS